MNIEEMARNLADVRRAAQANGQRVIELEAELERARPMAAAAHAYCAAYEIGSASIDDQQRGINAHLALLAAHRAMTPSETPPTHVIVEVAELERLRLIQRRAHSFNRGEMPSFPRRTGDLAADVAHFILDGAS